MSDTHTITISLTLQISEETLRDIGSAAVEGGIGYWSEIEGYDYESSNMGVLYELDECGNVTARNRKFNLTTAEILQGCIRVLDPNFKVCESIREYVKLALIEDDAGNVDAEVADVIVQAAWFNEIVYG